MKTDKELENIRSFVDSTYNSRFSQLLINTKDNYDPLTSDLGFCFKHVDSNTGGTVYNITHTKTGIQRTDLRVLMHEYGHIYLGHLDGIHEDLDSQACYVFDVYRDELIKEINESCGIDFADKLIERVIDDPSLNHSLHNIAMDMEVNSTVLSTEDIEIMEKDISTFFPKTEEELLKYLADNCEDPEKKKELEDAFKKSQAESKIKFIVPERYYISDGVPFPGGLKYEEYFIMIVKHLDQFVKMLVSIKNGGNGDTSQITKDDIQNALNKFAGKSDEYKQGYQDALDDYQNNQLGKSKQQHQQGNSGDNQQGQQGNGNSGDQQGQEQGQGSQSNGGGQGNQSGSSGGSSDYDKGYQDALNDIASGNSGNGMGSLSDLMNDLGMTGNSGSTKYSGKRGDSDGQKQDHRSDSRDEADHKRELGQIKSKGGLGCGNSGGPSGIREVDKDVDKVDMALREVFLNFRNRVIKVDSKKDLLKLYNKGINRTVIAPTYSRQYTVVNDPKIVYLIDISGSMDTRLVDRILKTIAANMKKLSRGLKYDIITWSTCLGEHIKDIDPRKGVPKISTGGGTRLAKGIQYFKEHYGKDAILVVISDFEDYLEEWIEVERKMDGYALYGFNYGRDNSSKMGWKNMKVRNFTS